MVLGGFVNTAVVLKFAMLPKGLIKQLLDLDWLKITIIHHVLGNVLEHQAGNLCRVKHFKHRRCISFGFAGGSTKSLISKQPQRQPMPILTSVTSSKL